MTSIRVYTTVQLKKKNSPIPEFSTVKEQEMPLSKIRDMFLDALESMGYGVIESITLWNTQYRDEVKAMPSNTKKTWLFGRTEITLTKGA